MIGLFESWLIWMFGPTLIVVALAVLLSVLGFKPPKHKPGQASWFKEE